VTVRRLIVIARIAKPQSFYLELPQRKVFRLQMRTNLFFDAA
jgi:hypothetical protein